MCLWMWVLFISLTEITFLILGATSVTTAPSLETEMPNETLGSGFKVPEEPKSTAAKTLDFGTLGLFGATSTHSGIFYAE